MKGLNATEFCRREESDAGQNITNEKEKIGVPCKPVPVGFPACIAEK